MLFTRTYPLRLVIILPFSFLFFIGAAAFSVISYQNSQTLARSMGQNFARELSQRIEQYVSNLTKVMPEITDANATQVLNGNLSIAQPQQNTPWLLSQLRQSEQLSFVSMAFPDGRYIAAARPPNSPEHIEIASNIFNPEHHLIGYMPDSSDHLGQAIEQVKVSYDPRQRPFMQCALANPQLPCWGEIYRYVQSEVYGISLSKAVLDAQGNVVAVVAADIALNRLNQFMEKLNIGYGGLAFLLEQQSGKLIASSNIQRIPVKAADGNRFLLKQHPIPLLRNLSISQQDNLVDSHVIADGKHYLLEVKQIKLGEQQSWQLVVLLPVDQIAAPIMQQVKVTLFITLLLLLLLIFIGAQLARKIARPIENIAQIASNNELQKLTENPSKHHQYVEVSHLATSLATLAKAQLDSIHTLEQQVSKRTLELQKANQRLTTLSEQDALTGIANRRVFDRCLVSEWQQAIAENSPLSVIVCDIDHFKSFNDYYGHQAGDKALQAVAQHLQAHVRHSSDLLARYGGEEFALILPNTDAAQAAKIAENLRQSLFAAAIPRADLAPWVISLSLGYASTYPQESQKVEELVRRADKQLYVAKANGRNQVQPASTTIV